METVLVNRSFTINSAHSCVILRVVIVHCESQFTVDEISCNRYLARARIHIDTYSADHIVQVRQLSNSRIRLFMPRGHLTSHSGTCDWPYSDGRKRSCIADILTYHVLSSTTALKSKDVDLQIFTDLRICATFRCQ